MKNEDFDCTDAKMLRIVAEEKLSEKNKNAANLVLETDAKKLLHELQVHQIELEMQNEELRRAYEITELALKRYTLLYDFAPMGYFTLGTDGSIIELNFTGAEIFNERRFSLINKNMKFFVSEDSLPDFNTFLSKVFVSTTKESCEVKLKLSNKITTQVYMEGVVIGDDQQCLLSVVDIINFNKQTKASSHF
jgi:hypothetical protein